MKIKLTSSLLFVCLLFSISSFAQKSYGDLYHPTADAAADITAMTAKAKAENKHLILQLGGNWCGWGYRFHDFVAQNDTLQGIVNDHFLVYHLNYSKENLNEELLKKYRFPQRFGFPVFVILDSDGQILHTQDSALLESGDGYDSKKVEGFFRSWTAEALDPATYEEKK